MMRIGVNYIIIDLNDVRIRGSTSGTYILIIPAVADYTYTEHDIHDY